MSRKNTPDIVSDSAAARPRPLSLDARLDQALMDSFPASDPPALLRGVEQEDVPEGSDRTIFRRPRKVIPIRRG